MKKKIIQKAIELFDERGFFDVRMRDISTALGVSVGSLTYHFRSKEALMQPIYRYMLKTLEGLSISGRLFQKKGEELEVAELYLEYMQQFRFFFQDTLDIIRTYPEIGSRWPRKSISSRTCYICRQGKAPWWRSRFPAYTTRWRK